MTLVVLAASELFVCAMESVQHSHHPIHLVEPGWVGIGNTLKPIPV